MIHVCLLLFVLSFSPPLGNTQGREAQESIDTRQDERIASTQYQVVTNTTKIDELTDLVTKLTVKLDTYTGSIATMGAIFGVVFTVLQILMLKAQMKSNEVSRRWDGKERRSQ